MCGVASGFVESSGLLRPSFDRPAAPSVPPRPLGGLRLCSVGSSTRSHHPASHPMLNSLAENLMGARRTGLSAREFNMGGCGSNTTWRHSDDSEVCGGWKLRSRGGSQGCSQGRSAAPGKGQRCQGKASGTEGRSAAPGKGSQRQRAKTLGWASCALSRSTIQDAPENGRSRG